MGNIWLTILFVKVIYIGACPQAEQARIHDRTLVPHLAMDATNVTKPCEEYLLGARARQGSAEQDGGGA